MLSNAIHPHKFGLRSGDDKQLLHLDHPSDGFCGDAGN